MQRTKELLEQLQQSDNDETDDGLLALADEGVNYIVYSSLTDPDILAQITRVLGEPERGTCKIFYPTLSTGLFSRVFKYFGIGNKTT